MSTMPLTFGNISTILLRRKRLLLTVGVLSAGLGFVGSINLPQRYIAVGSMIAETGELNGPQGGTAAAAAKSDSEGIVITQIEVLRSVGLIKKVVEKLKLDVNQEFRPETSWPAVVEAARLGIAPLFEKMSQWLFPAEQTTTERAVDYVQRHLRVAAAERSSVLTIQYSAASPALAVSLVDALMQEYLDDDLERRAEQIRQMEAWLNVHAKALEEDADAADQKVNQFVKLHSQLGEVMNSLPAAVQLNALQSKLLEARQDLARQQALFETVSKGGSAAEEILNSKMIQTYKELEARIVEQLAMLGPTDPRRTNIQSALGSIRAEIADEKLQITTSIRRNWDVAKANVRVLETNIQDNEKREQSSSLDAATLANLRATVQAKQQLVAAFNSQSQQMRTAVAAQAPAARVLYKGFLPPHHSLTIPVLFISGFAGMLLVGGVSVLRDILRGRVTSPDQVAVSTGLPVIASLPELTRQGKPIPLVTETVRAMWCNVLSRPSQGVVITVTSSDQGEGKTTVTAMMSRRIAADGARVLVIDADLRRRGMGLKLKALPKIPMDAVLAGKAPLSEAIYHDVSGVDYFLPDASVENPIAVLQSPAFRHLIETSKASYDVVFLDAPPVLRVADPLILAKLSDHILFIVGAGSASADLVSDAVARFAADDRRKVVTVLNRVAKVDLWAGNYYSGYEAKA
jgi:succinoglycan biosynthesis transport protein ExoP